MNVKYRNIVDNGIYYSLCGMMMTNAFSAIIPRHLFSLMIVLVIIRVALWRFSGLHTEIHSKVKILSGLIMLLALGIFMAAIHSGHWFDVTFGGGEIFSHTVWGAILLLVVSKFICSKKRLYMLLTFAITGLVISDIYALKQHFGGMGRVDSFSTNPNILSSLLEPLAIVVFVGAIKFWHHVKVSLSLAIVFMITIVAILFTQSRGSWVAIFGTMLILVPTFKTRYRTIVLRGLSCVAICAVVAVVSTNSFDRINSVGDMQEQSHTERVLTMKAGLEMFIDNPVLGVGMDNWGEQYHTKYISPYAKIKHLTTSHNNYLQILSECGLVGFIPYAMVITYILTFAWHRRDNLAAVAILGMTAVILLHGMVDCIYFMRATMRWYWMLLAVLMQLVNIDEVLEKDMWPVV